MTEIPLQEPWGKKWCCNPQILHWPCIFFSLALARVLNVPSSPHSSTLWTMRMSLFFFVHFANKQRVTWMCVFAMQLFFFIIDLWIMSKQVMHVDCLQSQHQPLIIVLCVKGWHLQLDHATITSFQSVKHSMSTQQCREVMGPVFRKWVPLNPINCHHHCYPLTQHTNVQQPGSLK